MNINPLKKLFESAFIRFSLFGIDDAIIAGIGGSLVSGFFGSKATSDANEASIASAREQMAFQERMSNTAHQRQVEDLRAAGLNPILSAKYGGASTPGGSMPQIQSAAPSWQAAGQAIGQIPAGMQATASARNLETQNAKIQAETRQVEQNIKNLKSQRHLTIAQMQQVTEQTNYLDLQKDKIIAEFDSLKMKNATEKEITDFLLTNPVLLEVQAMSRATGVDVGDIIDLIPSMKNISRAWNNIFKKGK